MRSRSVVLLLVLATVAAGVPALFLPFAFSVSPLSALRDAGRDELWQLAVPFFLVVPLGVLAARLALSGRIAPAERAVARLLAAGTGAASLSYLVPRCGDLGGLRDVAAFAAALATLMLGGAFAWALGRFTGVAGIDALIALEVPYLANLLLCLIGFWGDWQAGAYASAVAAAAAVATVVAARRVVRAPGQGARPH